MNREFLSVINNIKNEIKIAQQKALYNVNKEMIVLYWKIGKIIYEKSIWGNEFVVKLSQEIKKEFPSNRGFSVRNLKTMLSFYRNYKDFEFVQAVTAQITWTHNVELLRVNNIEEKKWYIEQTISNGWSSRVLSFQIDSNLYARQKHVSKINNFNSNLPDIQSGLAIETMKDPYVFDFIDTSGKIKEKVLEDKLINNITKMLLEMGNGFAFVAHQYHLNVGGDDFYVDLLLYNIKLKCYVVVELKSTEFKPEYAGQLSFYLTAIDEKLKMNNDNPTIGLLLCKDKNNIVAEYTLRDMNKPMGVSSYRIKDALPNDLEKSLPSLNKLIETINEEKIDGDD